MVEGDFTRQEHRLAEWLYERILMERRVANPAAYADAPAWPGVALASVRLSYLREAREMVNVAAGRAGTMPQAVNDV